MNQCRICGKINTDDARFCFGCGTPLSQAPPVKVEVKSPLTGLPSSPPMSMPMVPSMYTSRQGVRPGSCYYHPDLPSSYVCSRCGRSICAGCNKQYGVLTFCPECFWGLSPKIGYSPQQYQYQYPYQVEYQQQPQQGLRSIFG